MRPSTKGAHAPPIARPKRTHNWKGSDQFREGLVLEHVLTACGMISPKMTIIVVDTMTAATPPPRTSLRKIGRDSLTICEGPVVSQRYGQGHALAIRLHEHGADCSRVNEETYHISQ